jgi:hypothetical protein
MKSHTIGTAMTKAARKKLHAAINGLTADQVARIVQKFFPQVRGRKIDVLAKAVIADAHRKVSPRVPRMKRG